MGERVCALWWEGARVGSIRIPISNDVEQRRHRLPNVAEKGVTMYDAMQWVIGGFIGLFFGIMLLPFVIRFVNWWWDKWL